MHFAPAWGGDRAVNRGGCTRGRRYSFACRMVRHLPPIYLLFLWLGLPLVQAQERIWHCGVASPPAMAAAEWARQRARPAALPAQGTLRLLMVRVDFSDLPGSPLDEGTATSLVQGADQMFAEMSVGRLRLAPLTAGGSAVTPVLRLPLPASVYGIAGVGRLRDDALLAAGAAGFDPSGFDLDVICFGPANGPAFNFSGFANVGSRGAWLRDSFLEPGNLVHELGHNFGLNHANAWDTAGGPPTGAGQELEYADVSDSMSRSTGLTHHFNAQKKAQLGWLTADEVRRVETSGVYRVYADDVITAAPGPRALVLARSSLTNYWLELRQQLVNIPGWTNSLAIRWAEDNARPTLLLDTTPGSRGAFRDAALQPGWTFSDRAAGLHFRNRGLHPAAAGVPASLDVEIQLGNFPGNHPPTASLAPAASTAAVNSPLNFTVTAADADADFLSYAWDFGDGTFGPDAAAVAKTFSAEGDYLVRCTVSDGKGGIAVVQTIVAVGAVNTGRLAGFIRDSHGLGVGGVWVTLGANQSTLTDATGRYVFTGANAGSYTVRPLAEAGLVDPSERGIQLAGTGTGTVADFTFYDVAGLRSVTLVPTGAGWRFHDDGSNPPADWRSVAYSDAGWGRGPAPLGYGYADLGTVVRYGPNPSGRWITTYFRRQFLVDNPADFLGARLAMQVDDAAVVYLNGQEVWRRNLPDGPVNFLTLPRGETTETEAHQFSVAVLNSAAWLTGTNVVAVELHQWRPTDVDLRMELQLQGLTRDDVLVPVRVVGQPEPLSLTSGQSGALRVEATGTEPLTFQWLHGGVAVPGATQSVLTFVGGQSADAGEYWCQVGNAGGNVLSSRAAVTVLATPEVVTQPQDRSVNEGADAQFSVAAVGAGPLQYQWLKNDAPIAGAINAILLLSAVTPLATGTYRVRVSNAQGTVTSNPALLMVLERPRITQAPGNRTVLAGAPFVLSVVATGAAPLLYEWRQAGVPIAGGTNATLNVSGLPAVPGSVEFQVLIRNVAGSVTSAPVLVTVNSGPVITVAPTNLAVVLGQPAQFEVRAGGTPPLTYRWWHDGVLLPGATGDRLEIPATVLADGGRYQVSVGGVSGSVTNEASLTIWVAPSIVSAPTGFVGLIGESGKLEVVASGAPAPQWQWFKDDQPIPGATQAVLLFASLQLADTGRYTVRAENPAGSVVSSPAEIHVLDPGIDTAPFIVIPPMDATLFVGATTTLRVAAAGFPTPTLQWLKDGTEISGATDSELNIGPATLAMAGNYSVRVSNRKGTIESTPAVVVVGVGPQFVIQPQGADLVAGVDRTLIALVTSETPASYQWLKNGVELAGETQSNLRLHAVGESHSGEYRIIARNLYGAVTSAPAVVRVFVKPTITRQPAAIVVAAGAAAEFSVGVTGTAPLTFTWRRNGLTVAIRTNVTTLLLPAVTAAQVGSYTVTVANLAGSVASSPASLTVGVPISIQVPPIGTNTVAGRPFTLQVVATGDGPLRYQWRRDGVDLLKATNATLVFPALLAADAGVYTVVVRNTAMSVESSPAQLTVASPPVIVRAPVSLVAATGAEVLLEVVATGSEPREYHWLRGGVEVAAAPQAAVWPRAAVQPSDSGTYQVRVQNPVGSVTSDPFELVIQDPPQIITPPTSPTVTAGTAVEFRVVATGTDLTYQWHHDGADLPGATLATFALASATLGDAGDYQVSVSNRVGSVSAGPVRLTVLAPAVAPTFTAVTVEPAGIRLRLQGTPGRNYRLESSADLHLWVGEAPVLVGEDGSGERFVVLPTEGGAGANRFFRAWSP